MRSLAIAGATIGMLWALLPAATLASTDATHVTVRLQTPCLDGVSAPGAKVKLDWRSAGGTVKVAETFTANGTDGDWEMCGDRLAQVGDVIKVTANGQLHQLKVPNFVIRIDRVANRIYGRAPAHSSVDLTRPYSITLQANAKGKWSWTPGSDIYGGAYVEGQLVAGNGDMVIAHTLIAQIEVEIGGSHFGGWATPKQKVVATLSTNTGAAANLLAAKGRGKVFASPYGSYDGNFRDSNGKKVKVAPGDVVSAPSVASDAVWTVPQIDGTVDAASNVVTGYCSDNGTRLNIYAAFVYGSGFHTGAGRAWGTYDADGRFTVDFDDPASATGVFDSTAYDVQSGDIFEIDCFQTSGDYVVAKWIAP